MSEIISFDLFLFYMVSFLYFDMLCIGC